MFDDEPLRWTPQPGPQEAAIRASFIDELFFGGARGGGKLCSCQTLIITPKGSVKMGDLRLGDSVTDPTTGGSCTVIGIFPQGVVPMVRVTFDDGVSTLVGLEHLWAYKLPNHQRPRTKASTERAYAVEELGAAPPTDRWNRLRVGPTTDLQDALKKGHRPRIPLSEPVIYTVNGRTGTGPLEPYFLGLLLGDGHIKSAQITSCDPEIHAYLERLGYRPSLDRDEAPPGRHWICKGAFKRAVRQWAANHGLLDCVARDKFIPTYVFTAPLSYRLEFLRGLMDSDGTADERGRCFFTSVSLALVEGVRRLVWSLGGKASLRTLSPRYYTHNGERRVGQQAYTTRLWMRRTSALFRLPRKQARCADSWNGGHELMREVVDIQPVASEEAQCIKVSSPYGLYMQDDFIVTHNSDYLLGDYAADIERYGPAWRGILFRRNFPDLEEIEMRAREMYLTMFPGAEYRIGSRTWHFPNGAWLRLRHLENEGDADKYIGHQYCVAEGTPVRMADHSYRPIEQVRVGDWVQTLEGPRQVTATMTPQYKECVAAYANGAWLQAHPCDHPILTSASWQSYASARDSAATDSLPSSPGSVRPPSVCVDAVCAPRSQGGAFPRSPGGGPIATDTHCPGTRPEWYSRSRQYLGPVASWLYGGQAKQTIRVRESQDRTFWPLGPGGAACGPLDPRTSADFPRDCRPMPRSDGGPPLGLLETVPGGAPSPVDVASPYLDGCTQDDRGNIPRYTPDGVLQYAHPYTGALRRGWCDGSSVALRLVPCGVKKVYDLTVDEVNHYITTEQGLINRNSWIGFDELPTWPDLKAYHKLKACLRSAHKIESKRIRCTGNPGGIGHQAVKKYFGIEGEGKYGHKVIVDDLSNMTRMFIPSRVQDNQILMQNDPMYTNRLQAQAHSDPQLVKAWLEGDWDAFVGQYFSQWDERAVMVDPFEVPADWPLFGGLDYGEAKPTAFQLYTVDYDDTLILLAEYYQDNSTATEIGRAHV